MLSMPVFILCVTIILGGIAWLAQHLFTPPAWPEDGPKTIPRTSVFGRLDYFWAPYTFHRAGLAATKAGAFGFNLARHRVTALSGHAGRQVFFSSNRLSFGRGYGVLFGASPSSEYNAQQTLSDETEDAYTRHFTKRIVALLKPDRLERSLPTLVNDTVQAMEKFGDSGTTDPFESIYELVFRLTMRTVGCTEIAEDDKLLRHTLKLFGRVENSSGPVSLLAPWFPGPAKLSQWLNGGRLYMLMQRIVDGRKKDGKVYDDPLQYIIDEGDDTKQLVMFTLGSLFAGQTNSGINIAWALLYLSAPKNRHMLGRARREVEAVADKHGAGSTLVEKLRSLPISAYEDGFPFLDLVMREVIRLHLEGFAPRYVIHDTQLGDVTLPADSLAVYHTFDVHKDPEIYKQPASYDPTRFERGEGSESHTFVGWGSGRHPCLGKRFAQNESNLVLAMWIAHFDSTITDGRGNPLEDVPHQTRDHVSAAPPDQPLRLRYTRRANV